MQTQLLETAIMNRCTIWNDAYTGFKCFGV